MESKKTRKNTFLGMSIGGSKGGKEAKSWGRGGIVVKESVSFSIRGQLDRNGEK